MKKASSFGYVLLMLAGLVCAIVCAVQFVMAIRFGELGRVVFYFMLAAFSIELFAVALTRLVRMRKSKDAADQS